MRDADDAKRAERAQALQRRSAARVSEEAEGLVGFAEDFVGGAGEPAVEDGGVDLAEVGGEREVLVAREVE